jgi:hypothetical protein
MSLQLSIAVRNARLDAIEVAIGTAARLKIFSGAVPANCAAADPAGLLVTVVCPTDWLAAAASGSKALAGSWTVAASGSGTGISFRLYASDGTTCGAQGTVGTSGTDLVLDNNVIASGQTVTITGFTLTDANS